jgi:CheY-like chemotaxis protein
MAKSDTNNYIAVVDEFKPDLIILDYRLGNISGGEICQQIKAIPSLKQYPSSFFRPMLTTAMICLLMVAMPLSTNLLTWLS